MSSCGSRPRMAVDLSRSSNRGYDPGRSFVLRAIWLVVEAAFLLNPVVTSYRLKVGLLRLFGARVGHGVVIKPNVHVKYPWYLIIGDHCWIGERTWFDNFVEIRLGSNVCVSQGSYLCTGNHDWSDRTMPLVLQPVLIEDGAWLGAFCRVAPGVTVGARAILTLGSVLCSDAEPDGIYRGNPASRTATRVIRTGDETNTSGRLS